MSTGMTLKQFAMENFYKRLEDYREALESRDAGRIIKTSLLVYVARRNNEDRKAINRVFRECCRPVNPGESGDGFGEARGTV